MNGPQGAAFDAQGDLWVANTTGASIAEFTAAQLAAGGTPTPPVVITVPAMVTALTFDAAGDLWMTFSNDDIAEFTPNQLTTSASSPPPAATISSTIGTFGIAFDAAGDLWAATWTTGNSLVEYTHTQLANLGTSPNPPPAVTIGGLNAPVDPTFDSHGNLWFSAYGAPAVQEFTPAQLTATGSPSPHVSLTSAAFSTRPAWRSIPPVTSGSAT